MRSRHLLIVLLAALLCSVGEARKKYPAPLKSLPPIFAVDLADTLTEASGLGHSARTGHLYSVCDSTDCPYIYEMYLNGTLAHKWRFPERLNDLEAVAVDDRNGLILVAEEEDRRISSFVLPVNSEDWEVIDGEDWLRPVSSFSADQHDGSGQWGLEGLTVDTTRDYLYAVNQDHPMLFYTFDATGNELSLTYPTFGSSLSGLDYEAAADRVWVVSSQAQRVYVVDVTCTVVYDYWDLPVRAAEGIVVNNEATPPLLHIVTDSSSPSGPYVSALLTFALPEVGTGLKFPDVGWNTTAVECQGCDEVWEAIAEVEDAFYDEVYHQEAIYTAELLCVVAVVICPLCMLAMAGLVYQLRQYDGGAYPEYVYVPREKKPEASLWGDLFTRPTNSVEPKNPHMVVSSIPRSNFEDDVF